jgi:transposase
MGSYSVPQAIRDLRPADIDCLVKNIKGYFYVYERKSVPDPKHPGRIKKISGPCIGKIEGGAFVSNKSSDKPGLLLMDPEIKDYGEYAASLACSSEIYDSLLRHFNRDDATLIYALAIVYFVNGYTPASYVKDIFDESVLSNRWPTLPLSENTVGKFLEALGRHRTTAERFEQELINNGSKLFAIDGHVILCCSRQNDLADYGNKYIRLGNTQMNLMVVFDVEKNHPLTCKAFDGGLPDKSAVKDVFNAYKFNGVTFIVDMGFYSEENLTMHRKNDNHFVIPVPDNTVIAKTMKRDISFTGSFQYLKGNDPRTARNATILFRETTVSVLEDIAQKYQDEEAERKNAEAAAGTVEGRKPRKYYARKISRSENGSDRVIMFRDEEMHNKLVEEFRSQIGQDEVHTVERLEELQDSFGLIILRTEKSAEPADIFGTYKKRWKIETHYNHVRNGVDFNGLHEQNYYTQQGISFVLLVEGLIYSKFISKLKSSSSGYVKNLSVKECTKKAAHLKLARHQDGHWYTSTPKKKTLQLLEELGVSLEEDVKKLNNHVYGA